MAAKRKDSLGRELWKGERQKDDGRYEYRYLDRNGVRRSVYSWTLKQTDKPPKGKTAEACLREMERQIQRDLQDEIDTYSAQRKTLNVFFDACINDRQVKDTTRTNYKYMYKTFIRDVLGHKPLADIRYSDIRRFYTLLITEKNFKPNTVEIIHTILHPIFTTAVRDGYIRINPTDGVMAEIKSRHDWEKTKRHALTVKQQEVFVDFIANSETYRHWLPIMTVLLGTGGRISEILGLRWQDCDFEEDIITIDHNLVFHSRENGRCEHHITTPKTKAGVREIPMMPEVRKTLLEECLRQMREGFNRAEIDGYSGFIFTNRYGSVFQPNHINGAINRIIKAYNAAEEQSAADERRKPFLLPHFSAHNLRHTFCTRMCENTSDTNTLKVIQEIMGHADISTTLDVYTDLTRDQKKKAFEGLHGKFRIG